MKLMLAVFVAFAVSSASAFECPGDFGFYPNPDNCIKYYQCSEGIATPYTCENRKY